MSLISTAFRTIWALRQFAASRASAPRVQQLQDRRLRQLLLHANQHSAFYREKFTGIGLDTCSLRDLPTTNKAEIMAEFDRVVTDPSIRKSAVEDFVNDPANVGQLLDGKHHVCRTSGSQGQPMLLVQDPNVLDVLFACHMTRGNVGYAQRGMLEAARRLFRPARIAVITSQPGFFPSSWAWRHVPAFLRPFVRTLIIQSNEPDLVERLNAFRPTMLIGMPTTLDVLALQADRLHLDALEQVAVNSEALSDAVRERLTSTFGAPIVDIYGAGECLFMTNGCPTDGGAHINADWAVVEVVDEDNQPVPAGKLGAKILLTNLANKLQPLIRYEIRDRVMLAEGPCACGSCLPRIAQVEGRAADVFWVGHRGAERMLTITSFQHALEDFTQIREWQAVQTERNRFRVRLELLPGTTADLAAVRWRFNDWLKHEGLDGGINVDFSITPRLTADARTGKFRRIVPLATSAVPQRNDRPRSRRQTGTPALA